MRLRTDFWIAALRRRAEAAGAFVTIARKGADEAGAVFIGVDRRDGRHDLYGPAPQAVFGDGAPSDRVFMQCLAGVSGESIGERISSEVRFDPDLWLVDIEDPEGRPFVDVTEAQ